jgi:hypothetical protein
MKNESNVCGSKVLTIISLYPALIVLAMFIVVSGLASISLMAFSIATGETFAVVATHMLDWMPSLLSI